MKSTKRTVKKLQKGFAVMSPAARRQIASMGGRAISRKPGHMAKIGSVGGSAKHSR